MKSINKHIRFEVETRMSPWGMFGGGGTGTTDDKASDVGNDEYKEMTEDDLNILARVLGGG